MGPSLREDEAPEPLRPFDALTALGLLVAVLALAGGAGTGLFWPSGAEGLTATSVRGESVDLYGRGLYRFDTRFARAGARMPSRSLSGSRFCSSPSSSGTGARSAAVSS